MRQKNKLGKYAEGISKRIEDPIDHEVLLRYGENKNWLIRWGRGETNLVKLHLFS